jgi:pyrophosphatase PpaX
VTLSQNNRTRVADRWADGWRPRVWLFDFDGTLADSLDLIMASFRHATGRVLGAVPDEAVLRAGIGRPLIDQMRGLDPERAEELYDVYVEHNLRHHDDLLRPFPGVDELLAALRAQRRRLGIVTSKRRATAERGAELLGLGAFEVLVGWEDTDAHKPGPEPVLRALELLGADAADALYLGDAPWDIRCGRAAGAATAAVLWGAGSRDELAAERPDLIFEHPRAVLR